MPAFEISDQEMKALLHFLKNVKMLQEHLIHKHYRSLKMSRKAFKLRKEMRNIGIWLIRIALLLLLAGLFFWTFSF